MPQADELFFRSVEWIIITPENYQETFDRLSEKGSPLVLFGLTDNGYEALATNLSSLRAFVQQQQIIIAAYERYYKESEEALDAANAEIQETADEARAIRNQSQQQGSRSLFRLRK